jgi:hypothetical protein
MLACTSMSGAATIPANWGSRGSYADCVAEGRGSGWWLRPKWLRGIGGRLGDAIEARLPEDPNARLELLETSLSDQIKIYGPDGGPTAKVRSLIAKQLEAMGRYAEARLLWVEVLTASRKHLGDDAPDTLDAETWLVRNLVISGMSDAARSGAQHLYAARLKVNGPDDKTTLWVERLLVNLPQKDPEASD